MEELNELILYVVVSKKTSGSRTIC